jgi:hypothetical protein
MNLLQKYSLMKMTQKIILSLFALTVSQILSAQTILTGKVTDSNSEPLVGANVYVMNQNTRSLAGCFVGDNGEYRLQVPAQQNLSIVISFIGYKTQVVAYTGHPEHYP